MVCDFGALGAPICYTPAMPGLYALATTDGFWPAAASYFSIFGCRFFDRRAKNRQPEDRIYRSAEG
jgi:hypothetical protein